MYKSVRNATNNKNSIILSLEQLKLGLTDTICSLLHPVFTERARKQMSRPAKPSNVDVSIHGFSVIHPEFQ